MDQTALILLMYQYLSYFSIYSAVILVKIVQAPPLIFGNFPGPPLEIFPKVFSSPLKLGGGLMP